MSTPPEDPKKVWQAEEQRKTREKRTAVDTAPYVDPKTPETDLTDWQKMTALAAVKFPAHLATRFNLRPEQRTAAIAWKLGWTQEKIAKAAGVNLRTVSRWINENVEVAEFLKAFDFHEGSKDAKDMLEREQYSAIQTIVDIRDNTTVSAETRLRAAQWIYEAKYGKAKESKEIKGINLRELTSQLMTISPRDILDEEVLPEPPEAD